MSDWVIVHTSNNPNQSQIIKSVLKDNEINVVLMDKTDSMHKHLMNGQIEIYVQANDVIKAKYIISNNNL